MNNKCICIDGIIGAGKTTLIKSLKDTYTCFEEPVEQWTLLPKFYSDMKIYAEPFQFQVLFSQYTQYLSFKNIDNIVLVERSPETSLRIFTELLKEGGYFSENTFETYQHFVDLIGYKPDHYIYLDLDIYSAWERIQKRDRYEERNISFDYLLDLKIKYERFFAEKENVSVVNALQPTASVLHDVKNILNNLSK